MPFILIGAVWRLCLNKLWILYKNEGTFVFQRNINFKSVLFDFFAFLKKLNWLFCIFEIQANLIFEIKEQKIVFR